MPDRKSKLFWLLKISPLLLCALLGGVVAHAADDPVIKGGRPVPNPDPRSRTIPELVCLAERAVTVTHTNLESASEEAPLRLRLRGNLLYLGQSTNTEKFAGLISRADTRRWVSGEATLILDDALQQGVWIRAQLGATRVTPLACQPFDSSKR